MKRTQIPSMALRLSVFLLLGALTTVLVAWACALWAQEAGRRETVSESVRIEQPTYFDLRSIRMTSGIGVVRIIDIGRGGEWSPPPLPEVHFARPPSFPVWSSGWAVDDIPNGVERPYPAEEVAVGFPWLSMWYGVQWEYARRLSLSYDYQGTAITLPKWMPTGRLNRERAVPLRPIWPGFVLSVFFWSIVWWCLLCARRFSRAWHSDEIDPQAISNPALRLLALRRNGFRRIVMLAGLIIIGWRIALPIFDGYLSLKEWTAFFTADRSTALVWQERKAGTLTLDGERYPCWLLMNTFGHSSRYAYWRRVRLHEGWPAWKEADAIGEIVEIGPQPYECRVRWSDGSLSKPMVIGPRTSWSSDGAAFDYNSFWSSFQPGIEFLPVPFLKNLLIASLFTAFFAAGPVILLHSATRREVWRVGPVPRHCPHCRYDLRGLSTPGCPECGWRRS